MSLIPGNIYIKDKYILEKRCRNYKAVENNCKFIYDECLYLLEQIVEYKNFENSNQEYAPDI
jgi:hypothetical protein